LIGADAEVANREDLVVDVEARVDRRRVAPHLRHDQAAGIVARRGAEPGPRRRGAGPEAQPQGVEGLGVLQLRGPLYGSVPEAGEARARDLLRDLSEVVRGEAAGTRVLRIRRPHDVVEALRARGRLSDACIEEECEHGALRVIADRDVRRVLVRTVVLDPGIERRELRRLHRAARGRLQLLDHSRDVIEKLLARRQPGAM
jgi:hypothetical protein